MQSLPDSSLLSAIHSELSSYASLSRFVKKLSVLAGIRAEHDAERHEMVAVTIAHCEGAHSATFYRVAGLQPIADLNLL